MEIRDVFSFVISVINFIILMIVFNKAVFEPLIEGVAVKARRVSARIDEIAEIAVSAKKIEEESKKQFGTFAEDEAQLRADMDELIERTATEIRKGAEDEASHLISKARLEADKLRAEAASEIRAQMVAQAIAQVESNLRKLNSSAQGDLTRQSLTKVDKLRVS